MAMHDKTGVVFYWWRGGERFEFIAYYNDPMWILRHFNSVGWEIRSFYEHPYENPLDADGDTDE
jgi:hypothetical protein